MKIHLVTSCSGEISKRALILESAPFTLHSYANRNDFRCFEDGYYTQSNLGLRLIVDSGAFTAFTSSKIIRPQDYAEWALDFRRKWEYRLSALHFMNLDVIGDQGASWVNQSILEGFGLKPIPVVTYGAAKEHLCRAIDNYDYIALGGLVPYSRTKKPLQRWLDYCFSIVMRKYRQTDKMPKVHLLGITSEWTILRYPCYSSDSSTWVRCLRFGEAQAAGLEKIPTVNQHEASAIHSIRAYIKHFRKLEKHATELWSSRGIAWDD